MCVLTKYYRGLIYLPHSCPIKSFCCLCFKVSQTGFCCASLHISLLYFLLPTGQGEGPYEVMLPPPGSTMPQHSPPCRSVLQLAAACQQLGRSKQQECILSLLVRPEVRFPSATCRNRRLPGPLQAGCVPADLGLCVAPV